MDNVSGIDVKNNVISVGYFYDGNFSNYRYVRQINLSNGSNTDTTVYSTTTGTTALITGVPAW